MLQLCTNQLVWFVQVRVNNWFWSAPKLLDKLKRESEVKTTEEQKIAARSLVHNTLGVEGRAKASR
jgi:hypothetical protein